MVLRNPGPSVALPAGEYHLERIDLKGGFFCVAPMSIIDWDAGKVVRDASDGDHQPRQTVSAQDRRSAEADLVGASPGAGDPSRVRVARC